MIVLGIDPGETTGIAGYINGVLTSLNSVIGENVLARIELSISSQNNACDLFVVLEDSRLTKKIFTAPNVSPAARLKIARNIGEVDGMCKRIVELCEKHGVPCLSVSPKGKGKKVTDKRLFNFYTGWVGQSNQHTRDAAMVAWPHRNKRTL